MTAGYSINHIVRQVSRETGVAESDILSDSRLRRISVARHAAYFLARELTGFSFPQLGRRFRRDHSTVIHGHARCMELMAVSEGYRAMVVRLGDKCRPMVEKAMRKEVEPPTVPVQIAEPVQIRIRKPEPVISIAPKPKLLKPRKCCVTECGKTFHPESRFIRRCPNCRKQDGGMFEGYAL
ncbi:MAG: helix-turn-helix domain-containing protein [Rhodospirillales bacterium]